MKKITTLIIIGFIITQNVLAQDSLEESKSLGFIAYLNTIKEISENKVLWSEAKYNERKTKKLELINKPNTEEEKQNIERYYKEDNDVKQKIQEDYALLRWYTNLLINQFSADIVERNSIAEYRNMNKYISNGSDISPKLKKYQSVIKTIDEIYLELVSSKYITSGPLSVAGFQDIFTLAGIEPYQIYKDIKETKEKKIGMLIGYMKEMRLKQLSELTTPVKPKEEEKDKKDKI